MTNNDPRRNRRAMTLPTIPVRDNRIYEVLIMRDGFFQGRARDAYYYRRHIRGVVFTGTLTDAERLPRTARR